MSVITAESMRAGPLKRIRGHRLLEDLDFYRADGEESALVFLCESGDTHFLPLEDLEQVLALANQAAGPALPQPAIARKLMKLGILRAALAPSDGEAQS